MWTVIAYGIALVAIGHAGRAHRRLDMVEKVSIKLMERYHVEVDEDGEPLTDGAILDLGIMVNNFGKHAKGGLSALQAQLDILRGQMGMMYEEITDIANQMDED